MQSDQTLQTGNVADWVRSVHFGNFTAAHVDESYIKNNFNILASEPLDCAAARVFLLPTGFGKIVPIAEIELEQISARLCLANFSSRVHATRLREQLDLVVAFRGIAVSGEDITVDLALREEIVGYTLPQHSFTVSSSVENSLDLNLNIQIGQNSAHDPACYNETNLDALFFQLGSERLAECRFPVSSINPTGLRVDLDELQQSEYLNTGCYESVEQGDEETVFLFQITPGFGDESSVCGYIASNPSSYDPYFFTVSIPNRITTTSDNTLANTVALRYDENTLELRPCSVDDEGFDQGVSSLIPMGRLRFLLRVLTDYDFLPIAVSLPTLNIQDIDLRIVEGPDFLPASANETHVVQFTLETTECLWVITQHSEQPATPENFIGCTVDYLSQMSVVANVTFADAFSQSNRLLGEERNIVYQSTNASDCPIEAVTTDITSTYNAKLQVSDTRGNTENLNLANPIIVSIALDELLMQSFQGLSVIMDQVIVTLSSNAEDENIEYVRMFSVSEKIGQMGLDFHAYYFDGHFCRTFTDAVENVSSATCQRFYSDKPDAGGQWNGFLTEKTSEAAGFFLEDLDGSPRVATCQDVTRLKEDRFTFTPSNWIFGEYPYSSGTMTVMATAYVRSCVSIGNDFIGSRRALQTSNNDGSGSTIIMRNVSFVNSQVIIAGGNGNIVEDSLLRDLVITLAVVIALCSIPIIVLVVSKLRVNFYV